jgi:hypothetical protein
MNLLEPVLNVKKQFTIVEEIMVVVNGVHLHLPTQEIFVQNSGGQSQDILGTIFDGLAKNVQGRYPWAICPSESGDMIFDLKGELNHDP